MRTAALSSFCDFTQGGKHKLSGKHFVAQGFPAYGAGGLNGYLPEPEFDRDAVVLSAIGARCGKCFLATGEWVSLANTQIIFPDPTQSDVRFLWYQLNDERRWPRHGLAQPFIRPSDVKAHQVYLPSLDEQRRIAAILDKADALRDKRKRAIALLNTLTRSIFLEMFGAPHEGKWPIIPLGEAAANEDYRRRPVKSSERRSGRFPYYGASGVVDYVEEPIFSGRRLLVAEDGANLISRSTDIAFLADGEYWVNNHAHVLSDNGVCDLDFLRVFLLGRDLTSFVTGSAQPKLNRSNLDSIPVPLPPRQLQDQFALRLKAVSKLKDDQDIAERTAASLISTLQHRAFSGQL